VGNEERVISYNLACNAEPPRIVKKERPTLTADDLARFFEAARGERLEALWIVWALTGLRPGEILGLKWPYVRLDESGTGGEVLIRRSWSATRTGACMRGTTKTGKGRPVSLIPEAVTALKALKARYREELVKPRPLWETAWQVEPRFRDLVFPSLAGTPIGHDNLNKQ
jgi:integrase